MSETLPEDWCEALGNRLDAIDFDAITRFVAAERALHEVYPADGQVYEAFRLSPFDRVRAVVLGQDPYHEPGQAHGLAFSTLSQKWPPSLKNIIDELCHDSGFPAPASGSLEPWARNGVLLLNSVLTVRRGKANSHAGHGWEQLTSAVVDAVAAKPGPIAFMLWGGSAKTKGVLIDRKRHVVIECAHPSPRSAWRGFKGKHPFSQANVELEDRRAERVNWSLG